MLQGGEEARTWRRLRERSWGRAVRLAEERGAQPARGPPATEQPGGWLLHFHGANWGDVAGQTE